MLLLTICTSAEPWGRRDHQGTQPQQTTWQSSRSETTPMCLIISSLGTNHSLLWLQEAWHQANFRSSKIVLKVKILLNRHRVPIDLAIPSLRQHRTTPATDRDYPPPIGFLLHPAHLRFTFPIQSHVFKWQCMRNRPLLHFTPCIFISCSSSWPHAQVFSEASSHVSRPSSHPSRPSSLAWDDYESGPHFPPPIAVYE